MIYHRYQSVFKTIAATTALLLVAACSDSGADKATTTASAAKTAEASSTSAPAMAVDSQREGTWGDIVYGSADAPVTIIEYASLTCSHCATFKREIFPNLKKEFIDTGKVKFIYRNFLLNRVDMVASAVARCGDLKQTKKLMDVYFDRQGEWLSSQDPQSELAKLARRSVNMSRVKFDKCLSNKDMHKHLVQMQADGRKDYNIQATPTVIVDGSTLDGLSWETLKEAVEAQL